MLPLHHCLHHHQLSSKGHHPGWEVGKGRQEEGERGGRRDNGGRWGREGREGVERGGRRENEEGAEVGHEGKER